MNRDYKRIKLLLDEYKVPSTPNHAVNDIFNQAAKRLDSQRISYKSSSMQQILSQIKYISITFWVAQMIAIGFAVIIVMQMVPQETNIHQLILIIFPMVSILSLYGIPEIVKSKFNNMIEIESACKRGYTKTVETRILIIGVIDMLIILIVSIFLGNYFKQDILLLLLYGLVPFNIINVIGLYIVELVQSKYGAYVFASIDILMGIMLEYVTAKTKMPISGNATQNLLILIFLITLAILCHQIYKFIKSCNRREELNLWN